MFRPLSLPVSVAVAGRVAAACMTGACCGCDLDEPLVMVLVLLLGTSCCIWLVVEAVRLTPTVTSFFD